MNEPLQNLASIIGFSFDCIVWADVMEHIVEVISMITCIYGRGNFFSGQGLASELLIAGLRERGWQVKVITTPLLDRVGEHGQGKVMQLLGLSGRLLLAWWRGVSTAMLEAAACALPIIIPAGKLPERVRYGNGLQYREGDIADLARCIRQLAQDPAQARQWESRAAIWSRSIMAGQQSIASF